MGRRAMNGIALSVYLYVWQQKRTAGDESKNLAGTVSDKHYSCYYNHIQNFQTYMPDILNTGPYSCITVY